MRCPEQLVPALLALSLSPALAAQVTPPTAPVAPTPPLPLQMAPALDAQAVAQTQAEEAAAVVPPTLLRRLLRCEDGTDRAQGWLRNLKPDENGNAPPVFGTPCDVSWHKPIEILPYTYSPDYTGGQTEVLFSVSAKLRPLGPPLYFSYSQRSYWTLYDASRSRPFRETVYNPEIFYRWIPRPLQGDFTWGMDGGYEHESNGEDIPASRSWDRLTFSPFLERRGTAVQLKIWYRLPEDAKKDANDPSGDDNPDIEQYTGYTELHLWRRVGPDKRYHVMLRGNPATGRGAFQFEHSWRIGEGDLFWHTYLWHGYGESLQDYNDSVTRVGIGFALAR